MGQQIRRGYKLDQTGQETQDLLDKLEGVEAHAEVNTIESVKVNGDSLTPDADRAVNVPVPTNLSQLTSDATHRLVSDVEKARWNAKQDSETGKGLSTNDFTDAYKAELEELGLSAKVHYGVTMTDATTRNKVVTVDASFTDLQDGSIVAVNFYYGNTANNPTLEVNGTDAKRIAFRTEDGETPSIEDIGESQILLLAYDGSLWQVIGSVSGGSITIDSALDATSENPVQNKVIVTALSGKQDTISDLATIRSGAALGATAVQPGSLAAVATTGSYNDLSNKPSIPTKTSDLTNDSGFATTTQVDTAISNKQDTISDLSSIRSGAAAGATAVQPAALSAKQDTIADLSDIRSGAALGETSVQPVDIENMVEAEPIGSIIPPVNPSEFATKEEISQLSKEVGESNTEDVKTNFTLPNFFDARYVNYNTGGELDSQRPISMLRHVDVSAAQGKELHYGRATFNYPSNVYGMAFYDADKTYISGVNSLYDASLESPTIADYAVLVPSNAKYASFTVPASFKDTFEVYYYAQKIEYTSGIGKDVADLLGDVSALKQPRDIEIFEDNVVGRYYAEVTVASNRFNVLYRVLPGSIQQIRMKTGYQCGIRYKDVNGTIIKDHGWITATRPDDSFTPPIDGIVADILFEKMDGTPLISGGYTTKRDAINANLEICKIESYEIAERSITSVKDWALFEYIRRKERRSIRSVAHQGYYGSSGGYGNNMAQYYAKAAKYGFDFGECDIKFSSDNVPVCCHDATFKDEDSGTTITIANKTVAELKEYNYHGGKISTFEEVLMTCKLNGLGLYIDHFAYANTPEKKATLFSLVKKYSMERRVAWLINSGATSIAEAVLEWDAQASISVLATGLGDALVTEVNSLKTASNEIRLSLDYSNTLVSDIETYSVRLKPGIVIEVWTVDDIKAFKEYLPFVAAITSNRYSESMVVL